MQIVYCYNGATDSNVFPFVICVPQIPMQQSEA